MGTSKMRIPAVTEQFKEGWPEQRSKKTRKNGRESKVKKVLKQRKGDKTSVIRGTSN